MPINLSHAINWLRTLWGGRKLDPPQQEIIAGLDLGSSQIRVAIGKLCNDTMEIIGVGQSASQGMRKGVVVNPEATAIAIREAISAAELMTDCKIKKVVVGITDGCNRNPDAAITASAATNKIIKACQLAGLTDVKTVQKSLATAEMVLTPEERERGVVLIDFGSGTTDVAVFTGGILRHSLTMNSFCLQLTCDLAVGLRISMADAEQLKLQHGCCWSEMVSNNDTVEIISLKDNSKQRIPRQVIVDILESRMNEVFKLIVRNLEKAGYSRELLAGTVITGGMAQLSGMEELARQELKIPVRIEVPQFIKGVEDTVSPSCNFTAVGLVFCGISEKK